MTSSNLTKKIVSVSAALTLALGGAVVSTMPASAAPGPYNITYVNQLSSGTNGSCVTPAGTTQSDGTIAVDDNTCAYDNNNYQFLGWSETGFQGFTSGGGQLVYNGGSASATRTFTATADTTLYATWGFKFTSFQMYNPTEIVFPLSVADLDSSPALPSDFALTVNNVAKSIASISASKLTLAEPITANAQVRLSYTPVDGRRLMTSTYPLAPFTNVNISTSSVVFPPTFSNAAVASTSYNGASISYTSSFNGDLRYVVKLSSASAPASAEDVANGTYGSGVVSSSQYLGFTSPGSRTLSVSGLEASTSYKVWFAGLDNRYSTYSNLVELDFTTAAAPAAPTFSGTANVGSAVTASESGLWFYCSQSHGSGSLDNECMPIMGQMGPLMGMTVTIPETSLGAQPVNLVGKYLTVLSNSTSQASATQLIGASSGSNNNQNNNQVTNCAGQTGITSYAASSSTLAPGGSYTLVYNGNPSFNGCRLPTQGFATARFFNGALLGTFYYSGMSTAVQVSQYAFTFEQLERLVGRPLVNGDVVSGKIWVSPGMTEPSQTSAGDFSYTVTITGVSDSSSTDSTDVTDVAEPLPVWANNIVQSIPTLTKSLVTFGGSVALTGGDYADLKSITIGGKAVAFKVETTGNVTIPVPAGEAGKTADIVIVFSGGTMVVQDAIKYVAPINVAKIGERPIAIAAGAKRITAAVADQIRQAAFANTSNNTISCVAYAANNTAKAKAAAKLTAVQACGIATKANPALKAAEISVIVNKTKAKKEAVGIKVYKADN